MRKVNKAVQERMVTNKKLRFLQQEMLAMKGTTLEELVQKDIAEMKLLLQNAELKVISNPEKKTVVALITDINEKRISRRGIAKCYYLDQYNEIVGEGVAIRKVLGLKQREWENYL